MNSPDPARTSASRFLQAVSRSGLIESAAIRALSKEFPLTPAIKAEALADALIARQMLTSFQAAKLLQGTWHGLVLGPFQVLAPLGRGGMGTVYLARNTKAEGNGLPKLLALKVLPPKRAKQEQRTLARFLREMEMCRRVSHSHITKTFEVGVIDGVYYIAMEYIRGRSLSQIIKAEGSMSPERVAHLFGEVAAGLAHAHKQGLIHRDLKPSNVMVTPNDHAKILDLGLAMSVGEELPADKMIVGGQGYVVGTMDYIAPEQVNDPTAVDARADLYSLGCSMYYTLSGQPPFAGGTSVRKMRRHRTEYAEPLPDINPTVPVEFARVVEKLMEKEPEQRYQSAEQVRLALQPWAAGYPVRPFDVDPNMTEAEAIEQLQEEGQSGLWWQDVPAITFEATAKHRKPAVANPEQTKLKPAGALLALLLIAGLVVLMFLVELLRR